jgi:serine/threonine-protein kinase
MTSPAITLYDLAPGRTFAGRFRIERAHRHGGLFTAFEVSDSPGGARRELQLFPAGLFDRTEQVIEFARRLEPWCGVHSPNVVQVREIVALDQAGLALVTDLPKGESLRERLARSSPLARDEVVPLGRQLLTGLAEIHARGLVHGDVKPHTIRVEGGAATLEAQLVDGGITPGLWSAKGLGDKTALIGTPHYAPVEQFGGESPDVSSDLYNVAAVLFECCTGVLPWPGTTFLDVFQAKLDRRAPSMRLRAPQVDVDPALEKAVVRGCMAERGERYASAKEFLAALAAA